LALAQAFRAHVVDDELDYNRQLSLIPMVKKTSSAPKEPAMPASYEEALVELERLVVSMESGQLPLDHLLQGYQRGSELMSFCRQRLEAVEDQVKVLENGQLKPWVAP
jgi:exodeoxyribonuclease VII small subunit